MADSLDLRQFSRREFIKLSGAGLVSLLLLSQPSLAYADSINEQNTSISIGRVARKKVDLLDSPDPAAKAIRKLAMDEVLPITHTTIGTGDLANPVWYELNGEGFAHSAGIQPAANQLNDLVSSIPAAGLLSEVTVPYTDAVWNLEQKSPANRLYYSTTHWILAAQQDEQGNWWYEVLEDFYQESYFINAAHLRVIPLEELAPLSALVPPTEKRLEVRLNDQVVVAYEGDGQVQLFKCSAGISKNGSSLTPVGDFQTDYKRPSRHMIDGNDHQMNTYNLPGVPWISYLDEKGVAFHGTYWHNNFGVPMSHGCINLPSTAAKWIYRWTMPVVPPDAQRGYKLFGGTRVIIH